MIPYLSLIFISIGPLQIHVWGLLVALGIVSGAFVAKGFLKERQMKHEVIWDLTAWIIVGSLVMGRAFYVLFYDVSHFLSHPLEVFAIWHGGMSIMGGFFGAFVAGLLYLYFKKIPLFSYADTVIFGLPLGLFIGRLGCFLIHDHPGKETEFFLGVLYPDGVVRHDHGLYLSLNGLFLFLVFLWMRRKKRPVGSYLSVFFIWYGIVRFILDFYRATDGVIVDSRYFGMTPAQYFSLLMVAAGVWVWVTKVRKKPA